MFAPLVFKINCGRFLGRLVLGPSSRFALKHLRNFRIYSVFNWDFVDHDVVIGSKLKFMFFSSRLLC